ncbi:hypothetical protein [uncultured Alistipes sp.]|uniref:hypothetical protein n=1 Tax=uncultured Alistipes sp. TaxID=538949 RepID=UPI0025EBD921|nr:hypothetical protein [uncultured Alistipes sp.]
MVRNFTFRMVCAALFCILGCVACSDDPEVTPPVDNGEAVPEITIAAGQISETSVEIMLSAKHAGRMACVHVLEAYDDVAPTALEVFRRNEFVADASETATGHVIGELEPGTTYVVYAAACMDERYSEVKSLKVTTLPRVNMLSVVETTKSTFTYRVDVPEGTTFQHCYVEGWYYDYMLEQTKHDAGPEFDMNVFRWNLLADLGYEAEGPQDIFWYAGADNARRNEIAKIVGGQRYYALFSLYEAGNNWLGTPEAVAFETAPAGVSNETITVIDEEVSSNTVRVRMEVDENKVPFFFYNLYLKAHFDEVKAERGEAGIMDYLFEYAWSAENTYTDVWEVDPETSYMLAIMGVDKEGDLFYYEKQYDSEPLQVSLSVDMRPFERGLQGYHAYDTFEVVVTPVNFGEIAADGALWLMQPKAVLDGTLEMLGMTLETLALQPEYLSYVGGMPLPEDCAAQLAADGYFTVYPSDLEADTEYCYICAVPHGSSYVMAYATARTEARPQAGVVDDEYKALLGEWTLEGQSTEDYYTLKSYTLRFEELIPNRSYKVYGWSDSDVAQQFPFEVRYHTATKKITIEGHQLLGTWTKDGVDLQVIFESFIALNGGIHLSGYTGSVYRGSLNGDRLYMFPEYLVLDGRTYEFRTMAYAGYDSGEDVYYAFPGDEFQIVNFMVTRAAQSASVSPATYGAKGNMTTMTSIPWRPEPSVRAAAPAVRDTAARKPAVFTRR